MPRLGLGAAATFHENNSSLPYDQLKLKKDGDAATIRFIVNAEPKYADNGTVVEDPDYKTLQSLNIHNKFNVLNITRCAVDTDAPDPEACPLCAVKAPRSLKTYAAVVERGKEDDGIKIIEMGREMVKALIAVMDEVPRQDITGIDFKFKRTGDKTDTKYWFFPQHASIRPLNETELALQAQVDDMWDLIKVKPHDELQKSANDWTRYLESKESKTPEADGDEDGDGGSTKKAPPF